MITTFRVPYRNGELRIGWASWDHGEYEARSIKFAYPDSSGKISRGSPELPFDVLVDMLLLAADEGELVEIVPKAVPGDAREVSEVSLDELRDEEKTLSVALMRIQGMVSDIPWADWQPIYNQLGARLDVVNKEISERLSARDVDVGKS